jgi:uncharacterized membrane protein HdeD (DUF308 family)
MSQRNKIATTVSTTMVIIATVLLIGILLIFYSHNQNSHLTFYLGLIVTLAGVISGIFRIVIQGKT